MLQEFLRRGKKNGQTNLVPISGRVPVLNLEFAHGRSGVQPTVENLPKDRHGSGGFFGGFLRRIFWPQNAKEKSAEKIRRKIRQPKTKNPPAHNPPEIRQPGPKIRRKTYQQIRLSNLQVHAGFFRLRRIALGGVFRAWILGHSLAASGHGRGSHAEMHLQSLSCCWWDGQGLLRTLPDNSFSQKRSF